MRSFVRSEDADELTTTDILSYVGRVFHTIDIKKNKKWLKEMAMTVVGQADLATQVCMRAMVCCCRQCQYAMISSTTQKSPGLCTGASVSVPREQVQRRG